MKNEKYIQPLIFIFLQINHSYYREKDRKYKKKTSAETKVFLREILSNNTKEFL